MSDKPVTKWEASLGQCACGKASFASRKSAKRRSAQCHPGEHMSVYRCGDYWHIGHLPAAVIRGNATRSDL